MWTKPSPTTGHSQRSGRTAQPTGHPTQAASKMRWAQRLPQQLLACASVCLLASQIPAQAASYVVGGASGSLISDSGSWAWDGSYLQPFRQALENPANFGPAGVVNRSVTTTTLGAVNAASLSGLSMFVGTWISDAQAAPMQSAVMSFFLSGGDLWLLQDDDGHDGLGDALGLPTSASSGTVSNGGAPLYSGPFGSAVDVGQLYLVGQLSEAAVLAKNGTVSGRNAQNQVTSAYWRAGDYAPGAGALFITADIDMIASTDGLCGNPSCGASYSPLNANGVYALNTLGFLQQNSGGGGRVPEPGTLLLLAAAGLAWRGRHPGRSPAQPSSPSR